MGLDYQQIGQRIAVRRRALGLRQTQVCERCDINSNYLSNIERARSIPSLAVSYTHLTLPTICSV